MHAFLVTEELPRWEADMQSYEEFKEKLKKMRIDVYDAYEGEKGGIFDAWLRKMRDLSTK